MLASSPIDDALDRNPPPARASRRRTLTGLLAAALALGLAACASAPDPVSPDVRRALAPTGVLRVAVYPGSPTSLVRYVERSQMRGLTIDIGDELGRRLRVPVNIVPLTTPAEIVGALQRNEVDITITDATPERARRVDFTPPLVAVELGLLVPAGSPLTAVDKMDQPGARIGVTEGSSTQRVLGGRLQRATLVPMPTLEAAAQALAAGRLEAYATNKAILFEMSDRVPGSRVLEGRWGLEHLALATGPGRAEAMPWLRSFAASVAAGGDVARAAARAGLRGTVTAEAR